MIYKQIQDGEHVHAVFRKHWLPFVGTLIPFILIALLPSWVYSYITTAPQLETVYLSLQGSIGTDTLYFFYSLFLFVIFIATFTIFTDFYLDAWVLTDKRILDIEQGGFFNRTTSSVMLDHIQDVTVETFGFFPTLFGYGTLHIETAGGLHPFVIPLISRPNEVKRILVEFQMNARNRNRIPHSEPEML